jgi:hypothetical protein
MTAEEMKFFDSVNDDAYKNGIIKGEYMVLREAQALLTEFQALTARGLLLILEKRILNDKLSDKK